MSFLKKLGSAALKVGSAAMDGVKELSALADSMAHLSESELRDKMRSGSSEKEKMAAKMALKRKQG
jgi:hypothetical protein